MYICCTEPKWLSDWRSSTQEPPVRGRATWDRKRVFGHGCACNHSLRHERENASVHCFPWNQVTQLFDYCQKKTTPTTKIQTAAQCFIVLTKMFMHSVLIPSSPHFPATNVSSQIRWTATLSSVTFWHGSASTTCSRNSSLNSTVAQ